jgi:hypothetical protein
VRPDYVAVPEPFGGDVAQRVERVEQVGARHHFATRPVEALDAGAGGRTCRVVCGDKTLGSSTRHSGAIVTKRRKADIVPDLPVPWAIAPGRSLGDANGIAVLRVATDRAIVAARSVP